MEGENRSPTDASMENEKFVNGWLKKFLKGKEDQITAAELLVAGTNHAEIFRVISNGKGKGKSHVSGKYKEGELKGS